MYKTLKITTNVIVTTLSICGVVALILQSLVSFLIYPIGALFLYYLVILLLVTSLKNQFNKKFIPIVIWILVLIPVIWLLIAPEYLLFDLLMPNLHIDMK